MVTGSFFFRLYRRAAAGLSFIWGMFHMIS